jgi:hypothetical protein
MRKTTKEYREIPSHGFKEGDIIFCPSDMTGIKWRVIASNTRGVLAKTVKGQEHPKDYPYTIDISPEAVNQWTKIE